VRRTTERRGQESDTTRLERFLLGKKRGGEQEFFQLRRKREGEKRLGALHNEERKKRNNRTLKRGAHQILGEANTFIRKKNVSNELGYLYSFISSEKKKKKKCALITSKRGKRGTSVRQRPMRKKEKGPANACSERREVKETVTQAEGKGERRANQSFFAGKRGGQSLSKRGVLWSLEGRKDGIVISCHEKRKEKRFVQWLPKREGELPHRFVLKTHSAGPKKKKGGGSLTKERREEMTREAVQALEEKKGSR